MLYNRLCDYLTNKYSMRVKKICIDAGFTCPNRDGSKGYGGCIFCGVDGSGEQIELRDCSVEEQINREIERVGGEKFIGYYQNFTNTYASIDTLKKRFMPAINNEKIVALSIGTRPDCINEDVVKLLHELVQKKDISVELGLQTACDNTALKINRCYESSEFTSAVSLLNAYGIEIVVHIILGLPGEGQNELAETVKFLNMHNYSGIKIHSLYVTSGTILARQYLDGEYIPLELAEYARMAAYVITHISPNIIIHRITGDGDKKTLLAPSWSKNKIKVINAIYKELSDNKLVQGCFY